jgi:hypothetical protein
LLVAASGSTLKESALGAAMDRREGIQTAASTLQRMMDPEPPSDERLFVLSYMGLRRAVGVIGLALPIALLVGKPLLDGGGMQGSISAYYYTGMRNYFVGTLCALAVFLFSYRYAPHDNFLSNIASVFALGVVFFPTTPRGEDTTWTGRVHVVSALSFFLTLAVFAYFVFTRPPLPKEQLEPRKRTRNKIYRACGLIIVVCLALAPLLDLVLSDAVRDQIHPLFWLESIAVWAFSFSWMVKGDLIPFLQDSRSASGVAGGRDD